MLKWPQFPTRVEQLTGRRMYMTHRMRPIFPAKFAGPAIMVLLKKEETHPGSEGLKGMLEAIDRASVPSVETDGSKSF